MCILILFLHPLIDYQTSFLSLAAQNKHCMLVSLPCVLHVPAILTAFTWYPLIVCEEGKKLRSYALQFCPASCLLPVSIVEILLKLVIKQQMHMYNMLYHIILITNMFRLLLRLSSGYLYKSTEIYNTQPNCISGTNQRYSWCLKFPMWSQVVSLYTFENDKI
jgi:hypothetical protein